MKRYFMKPCLILSLIVVATFVGACSSSDNAGKEHFASSQQRALEKAKNVNNIVQQADQQQREQLEKMEH